LIWAGYLHLQSPHQPIKIGLRLGVATDQIGAPVERTNGHERHRIIDVREDVMDYGMIFDLISCRIQPVDEL
jgi:hypothetical protein